MTRWAGREHTVSNLEIPERAVDAALAANVAGLKSDSAQTLRLEAAAPIIVAAELIERADAIDSRALKANPGASVPLAQEAARLRRRAHELDPEGNTP